MEFLDSPVAARRMKVSDVLKVAKFYDKYEFIEGTKLCDDVLLDYFRSSIDQRQQNSLSLDVDLFIQSESGATNELVICEQQSSDGGAAVASSFLGGDGSW